MLSAPRRLIASILGNCEVSPSIGRPNSSYACISTPCVAASLEKPSFTVRANSGLIGTDLSPRPKRLSGVNAKLNPPYAPCWTGAYPARARVPYACVRPCSSISRFVFAVAPSFCSWRQPAIAKALRSKISTSFCPSTSICLPFSSLSSLPFSSRAFFCSGLTKPMTSFIAGRSGIFFLPA